MLEAKYTCVSPRSPLPPSPSSGLSCETKRSLRESQYSQHGLFKMRFSQKVRWSLKPLLLL